MVLQQTFKKTGKSKCIPFIVFLFTLQSSLYAFQVPAPFGRVRSETQGSNGKTLILIEEAHVEYEVQKNISQLLKFLITGQFAKMILVEGGWGNVSLSYLRTYGSPEGRLKVAEDYLKSGKIAGEEYLDITSDLDMKLWGIEDPARYRQNMQAFFAIHSEQEKWFSELAKLKTGLGILAGKVFSASLMEFAKKKEDFSGQKISLFEYLKFLAGTQADPRILKDFPALQKLSTLAGEGNFDPEKVEWEKQELVRALSRKMLKSEMEELQLHENRKTTEEELAFIRVLLAARGRETAAASSVKTGHLNAYARALEEGVKMDPSQLFRELQALENKVAGGLAATSGQKQLLAKLNAAALLEKLFKLELGPDDFAFLSTNPSDFNLSSWKNFLNSFQASIPSASFRTSEGGEKSLDFDASLLQHAIAQAREFYTAAEAREKAMIQNTVKKMDEEKENKAVLILGGFHTERLSRAFQKQGFSVVVVSPRAGAGIGSAAHQEHYFKILKEKWEDGNPSTATDLPSVVKNQGGFTQHAAQ